jgi:hypothetical protein
LQFISYLDPPLKKKKTGLKIKITGEVDFNMKKLLGIILVLGLLLSGNAYSKL